MKKNTLNIVKFSKVKKKMLNIWLKLLEGVHVVDAI